ncbi:SurA N-terminal domain-containing protein [Erythrobacter sp. W53]|uniref:SurA N-terminal domain-containing protein n=1 Tax=Erythrobacter sp. W53 TaxID=3425947 RepID=UPI003D767D36
MRTHFSFVAPAVLALAACGSVEGGQVAANVNGDEITYQEINAELRSMQVDEALSETAMQKKALERIIDRRLMAQAAKDEGLDQTPFFLLRERQLRDALLAQLLREQTEQSLGAADPETVTQFIEDNRARFAGRKLLTVARVSFDVPNDTEQLKSLEDAASLSAVIAGLRTLDLPFERGTAQLDSVFMGAEELATISALPDGKPFLLPEGSRMNIAVVQSIADAPLSAAEARPLATRMVLERQRDRTVGELVSNLRDNAQIAYRDEFDPALASEEAPESE